MSKITVLPKRWYLSKGRTKSGSECNTWRIRTVSISSKTLWTLETFSLSPGIPPSMSPPYKWALHSDHVPGALGNSGEETEYGNSWGWKHKTKATQSVLFTSSNQLPGSERCQSLLKTPALQDKGRTSHHPGDTFWTFDCWQQNPKQAASERTRDLSLNQFDWIP